VKKRSILIIFAVAIIVIVGLIFQDNLVLFVDLLTDRDGSNMVMVIGELEIGQLTNDEWELYDDFPNIPAWHTTAPPPPAPIPPVFYAYRVHLHIRDGSGRFIISRTIGAEEYLTPHDIFMVYNDDGFLTEDTSRLHLENFRLRAWVSNEEWGGIYTTNVYIPGFINMLDFSISELAELFYTTKSGNTIVIHAHAVWVPVN